MNESEIMKNETKVDILLGECESIISSVENVIFLCEDNDFVTNLLQVEGFENIRYTAEELQNLVVDFDEETDEYQKKCLLDEVYQKSVQLYQEIKYIVEAVEESITDEETCNELGYIRAAISVIREEVTTK